MTDAANVVALVLATAAILLFKFGDFQVTATAALIIATATVAMLVAAYAFDERGKDS